MRPVAKGGCGFAFSICLSALHYVSCAMFTRWWKARQRANSPKPDEAKPPVKLPLVEMVTYVLINDGAIVFLNLSLLLNPVFFYQARQRFL